MKIHPDFKELLELFNAHKVEYLIVGGYALAFHGAPRFTGDIDILVNPNPVNSQKIMAALETFGFGSVGLVEADFQKPDQVIQLGVPPVRIDLMTSISGVKTEEAFAAPEEGTYGDTPVKFISRELFIKNKQASGRKRDLSDLESLGEE